MTRRKKNKQPALQYSKKLSTAVTVIWCILRFAIMITSIIEPSIADSMVRLISGADSVMMVNLGFYTGNSTAEKAILAWMRKNELANEEEKEEGDENGERG